ERGPPGHDRRWVAAAGLAVRDRRPQWTDLAVRFRLDRVPRRRRIGRLELAGDWHSGPAAFLRDRRRGVAVQDLGWVVVPIVAEDVRYRPVELITRIERRLQRAA